MLYCTSPLSSLTQALNSPHQVHAVCMSVLMSTLCQMFVSFWSQGFCSSSIKSHTTAIVTASLVTHISQASLNCNPTCTTVIMLLNRTIQGTRFPDHPSSQDSREGHPCQCSFLKDIHQLGHNLKSGTLVAIVHFTSLATIKNLSELVHYYRTLT